MADHKQEFSFLSLIFCICQERSGYLQRKFLNLFFRTYLLDLCAKAFEFLLKMLTCWL